MHICLSHTHGRGFRRISTKSPANSKSKHAISPVLQNLLLPGTQMGPEIENEHKNSRRGSLSMSKMKSLPITSNGQRL